MQLQLYKLKFDAAHFGDGGLETSTPTFTAQRLYSALYLEALKLGKEDELTELAQSGDLRLSDGLFESYGLYFPKPIGYPRREDLKNHIDKNEGRRQSKLSKNINFMHEYDFSDYINGVAEDLEEIVEYERELYKTEYRGANTIGWSAENQLFEATPYRFAVTNYFQDSNLVVIGTKHELIELLFESLQYSGLGGKRSSGLGRFKLLAEELNDDIKKSVSTQVDGPCMLLNHSLPIDDELDEVLDSEAAFLLKRFGGFAYSEETEEHYRKEDYYLFESGSTFNKSFNGEMVDVSPSGFPHPVWLYNQPLFYRLEVD